MNKSANYQLVQTSYQNAPLFEDIPQIQDVKQGSVGDCYFMAAVASVIQHDPKQLMDNIRDNGDNTVTVRFFRERIQDDVYKDEENEEYSRLEKMDYANLTAKERFRRLLAMGARQRLGPNKPLTLEYLKEAGFVTEKQAEIYAREQAFQQLQSKVRNKLERKEMTQEEADAYLKDEKNLQSVIEQQKSWFWMKKNTILASMNMMIQNMPAGWSQRTVKGKNVVDSVLDSNLPQFSRMIALLKDPAATLEQAMEEFLSDQFHTEFFKVYLGGEFANAYEAETKYPM